MDLKFIRTLTDEQLADYGEELTEQTRRLADDEASPEPRRRRSLSYRKRIHSKDCSVFLAEHERRGLPR